MLSKFKVLPTQFLQDCAAPVRSCFISSHNSFPAFFLFLKGEREQGGTKFKTEGRFKRIWREIEFKVMNGKKRSSLGSCEDNKT